MTARKPLIIEIENDCGTFYINGVDQYDFPDYFYATYVLADKEKVLDYEAGYGDGIQEAIRRIKG
jgi:hypothetical protein